MGLKVALESFEVREGALGCDKAQLHQSACRVVDEDQKRAGRGAILEPAMLAAVDLHQLAQTLAPQPRLVQLPALLAGVPKAGADHPLAQRLSGDRQAMALAQHLGRERRAEVGIAFSNMPKGQLAQAVTQGPVRPPPPCSVAQGHGAGSVEGQKAMDLPAAQAQHRRCAHNSHTAGDHP